MGHWRFLKPDHRWRYDKRSSDNTMEMDPPPKMLSKDDVLKQIGNRKNMKFGKIAGKRKRTKPKLVFNWEKKSIFLVNYLISERT